MVVRCIASSGELVIETENVGVSEGRAEPLHGSEPRTYRAGTMKEALAQVRRDLGGDAVILATREVRRRRLFGLGTPRADRGDGVGRPR